MSSLENDVTIIYNFSNNTRNTEISSNIKIIKGDIRNNMLISGLCNMYDVIVHLAAQINVDKSINNPIYDAYNNINGTLNLLEMSIKSDIRNFIYMSCIW
jgi:UDP-glucose 4-epimerase